jgi:hypothetical protein
METLQQMTDVMQGMRGLLEHVVRLLDTQSRRMEDVMTELARLKESQNEILAGLALYERARRLRESLGLEQGESEPEESPWRGVQAYCRNCMKMVPIIEPTATFRDERTIVEAKCRYCGTWVVRTLV